MRLLVSSSSISRDASHQRTLLAVDRHLKSKHWLHWLDDCRVAGLIAALGLSGVTLVLPACGATATRGAALYQQQNYVEAAEAFERTQGRLASMETADRARYGLYRGLTYMALGDLRNAQRWLDYADAQQRTRLGRLAQNERDLLSRSRVELSQRVRDAWPKPERDSTQGLAARADLSDGSSASRKQ